MARIAMITPVLIKGGETWTLPGNLGKNIEIFKKNHILRAITWAVWLQNTNAWLIKNYVMVN